MSSNVNICLSVEEILSPLPAAYCDLCSKTFKNFPAFNLHRVKYHKMIETSSDERILRKLSDKFGPEYSQPSVTSRYFCPVKGCKYGFGECSSTCSKKIEKNRPNYFRDRRTLKQHYFKVHSEKCYVCSICGIRKFSLERDKRYHEKHCGQPTTAVVAVNSAVTTPVDPEPILIQTSVLVVYPVVAVHSPFKKSDIPIIPKPNSAWRCFVDKSDAAVQTTNDIVSVRIKRERTSARRRKKTKDCSVQADFDKEAMDLYNEAPDATGTGFNRDRLLSTASSCSLHLYDETACQTAVVQTLTAGVQSVVAQSDIFCQTNVPPLMADASVTADIIRSIDTTYVGRNSASFIAQSQQTGNSFLLSGFDENSTWSNIETQTDQSNWDDAMDFWDWRHNETQTSLIDFIDSFHSAGTQTQTDNFV